MFTVFDKTWQEYWAYRWNVEHRHKIPGIFESDRILADVVESACRLRPGMRILNPACGGGDLARTLARKGYAVTGRDNIESLIAYARKRARNEGLEIDFAIDDMRRTAYRHEFDAVLMLDGAFGAYGRKEDSVLLENLCRTLRPGGSIFVMYRSIDRLFGSSKVWFEHDDGWLMCEENYDELERVSYLDFVMVCDEGAMIRMRRSPESPADVVRYCYSYEEMRAMLESAGCDQFSSCFSRQLTPFSGEQPENPLPDIIVGRCG